MLRSLCNLAALAVLAAASGCVSFGAPKVDFPETPGAAAAASAPQAVAMAPVQQVAVAAPPPAANGAIFQSASYRPLFEDHRARLVGDSLTVQIVEKVSASQKSTSSVDKSGKVDAGISALPFLKPSALAKANASAGANSSNTFSGKGATESSNDFSGTITATVTGVLPNGHLLISGEKQIGVNHNVDVLRFTGQVDPRAIQPGNTVASAQVANVRVEHRGRGQQAEAQGVGWLGRFFLNVLPL
jgi:flagellar L-ring protein precursor FlgH